jgi:pyridoxamine 5'-phosphate oxidase
MDLNDVIEFANQNPVTWLATVDEGVPHVRGLLMWFADETGFYYHTASIKSLAAQIAKNGAVEAAFHHSNGAFGDSRMLRVNGTAEFVEDPELLKRLYEERPWILQNLKAMPKSAVSIFRIHEGYCHFWDMSANGRERDCPRIKFPRTSA